MMKVSDIFEVHYGVNLELNVLRKKNDGINFVSRTAKNNGVSARVERLSEVTPIPAGTISVAGGGSVMESFLQPEPYYSGRDLYYLVEKILLSDQQKLYYCACLRANKYRYNYGRQANRTLKDILIPAPGDIPQWVHDANPDMFLHANDAQENEKQLPLNTFSWKWFELHELFEIRKGKRLTKANMTTGTTPFIGAIDSNNGLTAYIGKPPIHDADVITVNYNGNGVAEAFFQTKPFWCSDDVNVLYPKFDITPHIAMFICTIIRMEKYRFNYGRKWHMERMRTSTIKLPITNNGEPDWKYMENYIKSLPFSSQI